MLGLLSLLKYSIYYQGDSTAYKFACPSLLLAQGINLLVCISTYLSNPSHVVHIKR